MPVEVGRESIGIVSRSVVRIALRDRVSSQRASHPGQHQVSCIRSEKIRHSQGVLDGQLARRTSVRERSAGPTRMQHLSFNDLETAVTICEDRFRILSPKS